MTTYGIDVNCLTRTHRTGTERYVFSLISEMMKQPLRDDERVVLYSSREIEDLGSLPEGWTWKIVRWPFAKGWTHGGLSIELLTRTPDVFFSPAHEIPILHRPVKIVSTIHDVAFRRFPDLYAPGSTKRQEWAVSRAVRQASRIITVSQTTKDDLIDLYRVPERKITPIHLCNDRDTSGSGDVLARLGLESIPYVLSISRLEKKKNIVTLVKAFTRLKEAGGVKDTKLVLVGSYGYGREEIEAAIATSTVKSQIIVTGYLEDADAATLMSRASAYAFPTHYEGFGIPALEAMSAGVPLIASDVPALREVSADAALFVRADDVDGWSRALNMVLRDPVIAEDLIVRGKERIKDFSWETTATKTWEVLRS